MFTTEILDCIDRSVLCWLATVDANGHPNVSPKEIFAVYDHSRFVIANIASPASVRNLRSNPNACVCVLDVFVQKGYKFQGTATIFEPKDLRYNELVVPLAAMTRNVFPILGVIEIEVTEIAPIIAPGYRMVPGTTEASQIAAAMSTYGVQPRER